MRKARSLLKVLWKYSTFSLLVNEYLLDHPGEGKRTMLLKLLERRYDRGSTVFCTQYAKKDWHARHGEAAQADALMDRIIHNTI